MNINWYPGHMKKTIEDISKKLKLVDFCIEIIDSRIPISSRNPLFNEVLKNKKRLIIFNKTDLSNPVENEKWLNYLNDENTKVLKYDATKPNVNLVVSESKNLMKDLLDRDRERGLNDRALRAMIVGIPNSGKSTFINGIVGRKSAKIGNRPGITKTNQWIRIHKDLHLLDTPGVLWQKFEKEETGLHLAFTGAIKDEIMDRETLALKLIEELIEKYPEYLKERYGVEIKTPLETMDDIAKKRGAIRRGAEIDYEKISAIILDEFRKGKIGRITLERI